MSDKPQDQTKTTPLSFVFKGYTIWLDLNPAVHQQTQSAMDLIKDRAGIVTSIPSPHVTLMYGVSFPCDDSARLSFRRFLSIAESEIKKENTKNTCLEKPGFQSFPSEEFNFNTQNWVQPLLPKGVLVDTELDGKNNGTMDMRWAEGKKEKKRIICCSDL